MRMLVQRIILYHYQKNLLSMLQALLQKNLESVKF